MNKGEQKLLALTTWDAEVSMAVVIVKLLSLKLKSAIKKEQEFYKGQVWMRNGHWVRATCTYLPTCMIPKVAGGPLETQESVLARVPNWFAIRLRFDECNLLCW